MARAAAAGPVRVPAPARHGRGAARHRPARRAATRCRIYAPVGAHARSAGLSGAPAAGERRQLAPSSTRSSTRACPPPRSSAATRSRRSPAPPRCVRTRRCAAAPTSSRPRGAIRRGFGPDRPGRCSPRSRRPRAPLPAAAGRPRRSSAAPRCDRRRAGERRTTRPTGDARRHGRPRPTPADDRRGARRRRAPAGQRARRRARRRCCAGPPISMRATPASSSPCWPARPARRCADAVAEVREAVDFLRYYADEARARWRRRAARRLRLHRPVELPAGDLHRPDRRRAGRRQRACWPSPPSRRPLIAASRGAADCTRPACPRAALQLLPGDGASRRRADLRPAHRRRLPSPARPRRRRRIDRAMAENSRPGAPLIAETGGLNAMIVDSTALPEQAVRDILASAFQSAGQRCSALRMPLRAGGRRRPPDSRCSRARWTS